MQEMNHFFIKNSNFSDIYDKFRKVMTTLNFYKNHIFNINYI